MDGVAWPKDDAINNQMALGEKGPPPLPGQPVASPRGSHGCAGAPCAGCLPAAHGA